MEFGCDACRRASALRSRPHPCSGECRLWKFVKYEISIHIFLFCNSLDIG